MAILGPENRYFQSGSLVSCRSRPSDNVPPARCPYPKLVLESHMDSPPFAFTRVHLTLHGHPYKEVFHGVTSSTSWQRVVQIP